MNYQKNKQTTLQTCHGDIPLPTFFPDATNAHVRTLDTKDVESCRVNGVVVNAYHLYKLGKGRIIEKAGGIHRFMNFSGAVITDSGGWQVMSLIHDNPGSGKITARGPEFFDPDLKKKVLFTPEKSIRLQMQIRPDIMICLDNCTRHDVSIHEQERAVELTLKWAQECKSEFTKLTVNSRQSAEKQKQPLLFAVIQGGNSKKLREKCAKGLLEIGFDGYSFGGHPLNSDGKLVEEILEYTARLVPDKFPKYAMGVGKPEDIVKCFKMGYTMFDCVIPTREARHGRLYIFRKDFHGFGPNDFHGTDSTDFYQYLYVNSKLENDQRPIDENCDCLTCQNYSRAYVYHLFRLHEPAGLRLATIHNLRFYTKLMEKLKNLT